MFKIIPTKELFNRYHSEKFHEFCTKCPNYTKNYSCPPFENGLSQDLLIDKFPYAHILCRTMDTKGMSKIGALKAMRAKKRATDIMLIQRVNAAGHGIAMSCTKCDLCSSCARSFPTPEPCPYPDKALLSIDSLSLNLIELCRDLFGIDIKFGKGNTPPEQITLLFAIFSDLKSETDFRRYDF